MDVISCPVRSASNPSITRLSDWHIQQIRTLVPEWQHFFAFLENFEELKNLSCQELDRLFDAIYPESWECDYEDDNYPKETCWNGIDDDGDFYWKDMTALHS